MTQIQYKGSYYPNLLMSSHCINKIFCWEDRTTFKPIPPWVGILGPRLPAYPSSQLIVTVIDWIKWIFFNKESYRTEALTSPQPCSHQFVKKTLFCYLFCARTVFKCRPRFSKWYLTGFLQALPIACVFALFSPGCSQWVGKAARRLGCRWKSLGESGFEGKEEQRAMAI